MQKKGKCLFIITLIISILASGCGKSLYESNKDGYTKVVSVRGVTFDMPESFLSQTTAITSISPDKEYTDTTYLYKDGKSSYLLFNMNSIVVAVENSTNFDLKNADDVLTAIEGNSLNGIWLQNTEDKFKYEESESKGIYKLIANVSADVSVTPQAYGIFTGQMAYIQKDNFECTMFIGARCESQEGLSSNQKKIIEHITKSLTVDSTSIVTVTPGANVNTEVSTETETSQTINTEIEIAPFDTEEVPVINTEIETENVIENTEIGATENMGTEVVGSTEIVQQIPSESESSTEVEIDNGNVPIIGTEGGTIVEETYEDYLIRESNQEETYNGYSDIYHMLSIGDKGRLRVHSNDYSSVETEYITINKLYTGQEAIDIVKKYRDSDASKEEYVEATAGYSYHVVEYDLERSPYELYVNIKILGLDGEQLRYRGVPCSSRTYDIFTYMTEDFSKLYCYYEVPNGCTEYMLECGTRISEMGDTACYLVDQY